MNKPLFIIFAVCFLFGCKDKPKQPAKDRATARSPQPVSLLKHNASKYQGVWIKSAYLEKIRQTKSVIASVDQVIGITGMQIDSNAIAGDSLTVSVGWDNQNPGAVVLTGKFGRNPNSLKFGDGELGYAITNGDTALIWYQVYNNQLFTTRYHKIAKVDPNKNVSDDINFAINNALITGDYLLTLGPKKVSKVIFTADGQVTGLEGFKKYFIENDLKPGPLNNMDLITFNEFTNKQAVYHYVFKGDTLELYEAWPNAKGTLMILGKLKYVLKRQ